MDNITYLAITIMSVIFTAGAFVGITRMSFKQVEATLKSMQLQIKEVRDDQKTISVLNTRMAVVEKGVEHLEKCQEHLQTDMTLVKKRQVRKIED